MEDPGAKVELPLMTVVKMGPRLDLWLWSFEICRELRRLPPRANKIVSWKSWTRF